MINRLFRDYFELLFWLGALVALGLSDPTQAPHYTLCPLKLMGITWCPGCGLGHSIAFLLHGDIPRSWHAHWLGIPALGVIAYRIVDLVKQRVNSPFRHVRPQHGGSAPNLQSIQHGGDPA